MEIRRHWYDQNIMLENEAHQRQALLQIDAVQNHRDVLTLRGQNFHVFYTSWGPKDIGITATNSFM